MISSNSHRGRGEAWGISVGNVLFLAVVYFQIFVGGEPSLPLKQDRGLLTTFGSADELVSYDVAVPWKIISLFHRERLSITVNDRCLPGAVLFGA